MSETIPTIPKGIDPELAEKVAGGTMCSPEEIGRLIGDLRTNYDQLVDFTSYVFDRIAGN